MIKKVIIYNRQSMDRLPPYGTESGFQYCYAPWSLVSIHGDSRKFLTPENVSKLKELGMRDSLSQEYWDITDDPELVAQLKIYKPQYILFSQEQAKEVVAFLSKLKDDPIDQILICHCDAGISRSGATGAFACQFFGLDYNEFSEDNPMIHPNRMVLRMLREAAGLAGPSEFMTAWEVKEEEKRKSMEVFIEKYGHIFI